MSLNNIVKRLQDVMRKDAGINGDAQRIEQIVWILFLKIYDAKEQEWELMEDSYQSIIPARLRWSEWAKDHKDGEALTGDALLNFVNTELFPTLKTLEISPTTPMKQRIIRAAFEDNNNYMKDGVLLRQVINIIDEIDFNQYTERHAFGDIYENILKSLQSAGNAGEFYTPRAVTEFMVKQIAPKLGETVADFACGTGGFLTSTLNTLWQQASTSEDRKMINRAIFGIEKKSLPHLLCVTNMFLHDIDSPNILHDNALERKVTEYSEQEKFDVILMNPPYGGSENDNIKVNFPAHLRSSETADLFMSVIMYRLKKNGRVAIVLPDGFLFGTDNAKVAIKQKLMSEMNLHTVIRLPHSVFAPYTSITTNILFFDNTQPTEETWFYRLDMPEGYKNFSKTKPMKLEHFNEVMDWWHQRQAIQVDGFDKARSYCYQEIADRQFNLDLCGFPHEEEEILPPDELIQQYQHKRTALNADIDELLNEITQILGIRL